MLFRSLRPAFRSIWGIGVVSVFLHAFVDYPFSRPALGSWPILILAMLAAAAPRKGREHELSPDARSTTLNPPVRDSRRF